MQAGKPLTRKNTLLKKICYDTWEKMAHSGEHLLRFMPAFGNGMEGRWFSFLQEDFPNSSCLEACTDSGQLWQR